jgi:large subunit ribosomal protein L21
MLVVLKTGNKQYRVSEGNFIDIEKLDAKEGEKIIFDEILLAEDDSGGILVGRPKVDGVIVEAEVMREFRSEKVMIFKFRKRKNSRTKGGHRQQKMRVKITSITFSNQSKEA